MNAVDENYIPDANAIEAERAVIGTLLLDSKELKALNLKPGDFFQDIHKRAYLAMLNLQAKGYPIDFLSVSDELKLNKLFNDSDLLYLMKAAESIPNTTNILYYARIVKRESIKRQMMNNGEQILKYAGNLDFEEARKKASEIILLNDNIDDKSFSDTFTEEDFERLSQSKRFFANDLYTLTFYLPFMRGENIYIAGKTSTGKTQLALNLALSFLEKGATIGYISMELGREQLLIRLLNWEMGNDQVRLSDIDIRQKDWWDLGMALIKQPKFKNFYFTEDYNKLNDIVAWIEMHKFDVVFVDYIQLIKSELGKNRVEELGDIAKEFRRLSKKRCMIILSQFNRAKDEDEEEIDLSRIRDSGEIEQTATGVIIIRRDKRMADQFYYAIAKNQTFGALSYWKKILLKSNGKFIEGG